MWAPRQVAGERSEGRRAPASAASGRLPACGGGLPAGPSPEGGAAAGATIDCEAQRARLVGGSELCNEAAGGLELTGQVRNSSCPLTA